MLHFIVNPAAGTGNSLKKWQLIEEELKRRGVVYRAHLTEGEGDAERLADTITSESGESDITLAVVGGDGTVSEVLTGIQSYSGVTLGYVPAGSGGDLARTLGLSRSPLQALDTILCRKSFIEMDVGRIETESLVRNFAVSAGIGFDAAVCHEALHSSLKKKLNRVRLGKLTYGLIALRQLAKLKPSDAQIILGDGKELRLKKMIFAAAMNGKYEGGGFRFSPEAENTDGYLDLCAAAGVSKPTILFLLPLALFGKHTGFKYIKSLRAEKFKIITRLPCAVHADGESCGISRNITIGLEPEKIRFIIDL